MTKLTASVVGGGTGGKLSLAALRASDRFELVAVADINPEVNASLAQQYPGLDTFASHQAMFENCPTDVVCVSTYPPSHEPITLDALDRATAGGAALKGILVEKPLGHTAASGRRVLEAVRAAGLPMAVPHGLLVRATPLAILDRVHRGEIGDLKLVEIQNTGWDILNAGIHWLDFFVVLTGCEEMAYVMAVCESSTRTYRDGMQVETTAVTYAQTASGIRAVMNTGDEVLVNREGKGTLFRLVGTAGQIEFWGWENAYHLLNAEHPHGRTFAPDPLPGTAHQRHLEGMAAMIVGGEVDYTIPESSLLALEICEGAYISSRHRCKVTFPVDRFIPPAPVDWDPGQPYSGQGGGRDGRKL
jgi:predicted dehydrogenase